MWHMSSVTDSLDYQISAASAPLLHMASPPSPLPQPSSATHSCSFSLPSLPFPSFLRMTKTTHHLFAIFLAFNFIFLRRQGASADDAAVMTVLKTSLNPPGWSGPDPCQWTGVGCSDDGRISRIQLGQKSLKGTLPPDLQKLDRLERLELGWNNIAGPVPSLSGLSSLQVVSLASNQLTSFPADFFLGLTALQSLEIDNNPFSAWEIPQSLRNATALRNFSANSANITGNIPDFLGPDEFPSLSLFHLAINSLEGELPATFSGSQIQSFWVNGQKSAGQLTGSIDVIQNMTMLKEVWLHSNGFTGPLPDFSGLGDLESLSLRDNKFTGPVPASLVNLKSLKAVNLTANLLQGPMPVFDTSVSVDMVNDSNSFCLPTPGDCDPRLNTLLSVLKPLDYPQRLAQNWKGNDPCAAWIGITCSKGEITVVNFAKMALTGTISPDFASLKSLQRLILADNNLTGSIPAELTTLAGLKELDVSNNQLNGKVPVFTSNISLDTKGNPGIGKEKPDPASNGSPAGSPGSGSNGGNKSSASILIILVTVLGAVIVIVSVLLGFCLYRRKHNRFSQVQSPKEMVIHPRHSGSDNESMKITVAGSSASVAISEIQTVPSSEPGDIQMVESGNKVFSIQVLRNATNNFNENNILGQGGFGVVYEGQLHDGTKTAVKRMESGVISGKGFTEFKSEITVLTKVRHRHLVTLLGYCLDGNEKLLVYEYMPQGTLSRHLFHWAEEGLKPMEWTRRLTIALDVARGVEYLHGLAHQSFIHRDLKPSNILLGDDMRAKVADFGLVRLAPEGKGSIETRIAGTFGYLAPEYAVTGRVTTKVDVYSFGVILMEIITGRKALDESQPEENMHLVTYFRRMYINKDAFRKSVDPTIDLNEETLASVHTVAELAGHCCAREPFQRPDMGHVVNVISSLVEFWKPSDLSSEDNDLNRSSTNFDYSTLLD